MSNKLKDIFVLNKDIIISSVNHLYFWKINEDNALTNAFNIELGNALNEIKSFLEYDNLFNFICL